MDMTFSQLKVVNDERKADPTNRGYAGKTDAEVATLMNAKSVQVLQSRFITVRTLLAEIGPTLTTSIMTKLEARSEKPVQYAVAAMKTYTEGSGIDIGHANTQAFIDSLQAGGVLTAEEANAVKNMGKVTVSRSEQLGLYNVTANDVARAREVYGS